MKTLKGIILMSFIAFLSACASGPSLDHYKDTQPALALDEYFNGPIKAWGIIQDRKGHVIRRFDVDMVGTWEGNSGTLEEDFEYYDGEKQRRVWKIEKIADTQYKGRADDIIGVAEGRVEGYGLRWAYKMDVPVGDKTYQLTFDDWMFLMNDGVLVNRSYLKKFGITVAELTLFMQKQDE